MLFDIRALPLKLHVGRAVLERGARLSTEDLNNLQGRSLWQYSSCNLYCTVALLFLGNLEKLFVGAIDQSVRWCRHNGIFERGEQVPGGRLMSSHQFLLWLGVDQTVTVTNTGVRGKEGVTLIFDALDEIRELARHSLPGQRWDQTSDQLPKWLRGKEH